MADDLHPQDPTTLTTQALLREITSLEKLVTQRMDAIEKAVAVAHENLTRVPTEVDKAIGHLGEVVNERFAITGETFRVHEEKFSSVQTQFRERDVRTEQSAKDTKTAIDAALQAAKELGAKQQEASEKANTKSELSFTKQFEGIGALISANTRASDEKIDDLKSRITSLEGQDRGQKTAVTTQQTSNAGTVGIIGLVLGTLVGIGGLVVAFVK